ncbi:TPA: hypothetical protein KEW44_004226 [Escherichia coli]|nr:hypothetical protein [Escherichia coli]MCN7216546.1 hypothetical protein [Escherichia coli]MDF9009265.1 hypothetical protein [Escherichia coli]HBC6279515.1 hypothetical protein [Escherichia coli]
MFSKLTQSSIKAMF